MSAVVAEVLVGLFFLLLPYETMALLEVQPSGEAAALFRLYGTTTLHRGMMHHVILAVPVPRIVRGALIANTVLAILSVWILTTAVLNHLAGPPTWYVVALFAVEAVGYLLALSQLWSASKDELEAAQRQCEGKRAP